MSDLHTALRRSEGVLNMALIAVREGLSALDDGSGALVADVSGTQRGRAVLAAMHARSLNVSIRQALDELSVAR